jgi:hypothetical protein
MHMRYLLAAILGILVIGCASTETVKEARGQGTSRTYPRPFDAVYDATLAAAQAKELEVVESDRAKGAIVLSRGVTLLSWGERIAVFVKSAGAAAAEVEIVSKPVVAPLNFPPDWENILLEQIGAELQRK